ncbi:MAG: hypothetical protein ACRDKV_06290 [Solirubrobacterales bacterium]
MRTAHSQQTRTPASRRTGRRHLLALSLVVALVASLATVPGASGSRGQTTLFDLGGVVLDMPQVQRTDLLNELQDFGVDTVRVMATWRDFAPDPQSSNRPAFDATNPAAYPAANWVELDDLVRGARARGMDVLLTPSSPTPRWGSRTGSETANPIPFHFGQFAQALGTRYSGAYTPPASATDPAPTVLPRVDKWSVYNEPNLTLFLRPQLRRGRSVAAKIYRRLFLAAQGGLRASGHGGDLLLIGETSPGPGRKGTDPIDFVRGVFCLNEKYKRKRGCKKIRADGWAQHPYDPFDAPFERPRKNLINLANIGKLTRALNKARRARAVNRRLPIYVTEYGIESVPDRKFGVSQLRQAEFISISEYLMYRIGRIRSFGQYLMSDDAGNAQVNFQTGLRFSDGRNKVSYSAFPIALVAQRRDKTRKKVTIWGHVRPRGAPFPVSVEINGGRVLRRISTNANGYFQFRTNFRKRRRYSATTVLPDGTQLTGPFVRVYTFK